MYPCTSTSLVLLDILKILQKHMILFAMDIVERCREGVSSPKKAGFEGLIFIFQ